MPRHTPLYDWSQRVATAFPDLPPATARVLADWSYGAGLLAGEVRTGRFQPEPWPQPDPIPAITEKMFCLQMTYP